MPFGFKEPGQDCGAFRGQDTVPYADPKRAAHIFQQLVEGAHTACAGVVRSEYAALNPGLKDHARAHHAGFQGDVERAVVEPPVASLCRSCSNRDDLRVSQRIVIQGAPVEPGAHESFRTYHDGTDRHLACSKSGSGKLKSLSHPPFVCLLHSQYTRQDLNLKPSDP